MLIPTELRPPMAQAPSQAPHAGFEPAISRLTTERPLLTGPMRQQADDRTRTDSLFVGNEALYQLRYTCASETEESNLEGTVRRSL